MTYLRHNYSKVYEDLVAGVMTREDIIAYTNEVFSFGKKIGNLEGQTEAIDRMNRILAVIGTTIEQEE